MVFTIFQHDNMVLFHHFQHAYGSTLTNVSTTNDYKDRDRNPVTENIGVFVFLILICSGTAFLWVYRLTFYKLGTFNTYPHPSFDVIYCQAATVLSSDTISIEYGMGLN